MTEQRRAPGRLTEVRVTDAAAGVFEARVLTYGTVDDYGTVWRPGVFADALAVRMPVITWAHDWSDPIGRWTDVVRDDDTALELRGRLDVHADVPRARQALAQFRSGTLDQFSVGFTRREWTVLEGEQTGELAGAREVMVRADLNEVSPVLVGGVQGTALLDVRRRLAGGVRDVPLDAVVELGRRVTAGTLTLEDAEAALALLASGAPVAGIVAPPAPTEPPLTTDHPDGSPPDPTSPGDQPAEPGVPPTDPPLDPDVEAALAEALEALDAGLLP